MTDGEKKYALAYRAKLEALRVRDFARVQQEEEYMRKIRSSYGISHEDARRIQRDVEGKTTMHANPKAPRRWPSVARVAEWLRATNNTFAADEDGIDVRLQVTDDGWQIWSGDPSYDTDHRGDWGASSIPGSGKRFDSIAVARELINEAKESRAMLANPDGDTQISAVAPTTGGSGAGLLAVGVLALIGGVIYVATRPDTTTVSTGGGALPPPAKAPPTKPKCLNCAPSPTGDMTEVESFAKDTGYNIWCVENQAVSTWEPATQKPAYTSDPKARAYSQVDCSFYTWSAGAWIKDEIMNGELQAWRSQFVGVSKHPVSAFVIGA